VFFQDLIFKIIVIEFLFVEIDNRKIIVEKKYCISDVIFTVQYNGLFKVE
jgi:hypothetical protein